MPTAIQSPNAWERLRRSFGIQGRHQLLLDEVVVPVVIIEDAQQQTIESENHATLIVEVPAVAATSGAAVLANLSPGTRLLVDRIYYSCSTTDAVQVALTTIAPILPLAGSTIVKSWNNADQPASPAGSGFANQNVFAPGNPGILYRPILLGATPHTIPSRFILEPNRVLSVANPRNNQAFAVTFQYRVEST